MIQPTQSCSLEQRMTFNRQNFSEAAAGGVL